MSELLKQGDVIELTDEKVYAKIPEHFAYANRVGVFDKLAGSEIRLSDDNWRGLQGRYIVTNTALTAGGTGHGPHDVYPDGHHVKCRKADGPGKGFEVSFYQTGSFTCMVRDPKVVGRAELEWRLP